MRKLTLSLIFLCIASMTATAKSVVFTLADDTKVYYLLGGETNPMMRFADGKLTVEADTYEFTDIKNFYISAEDDPAGIGNLLTKHNFSFQDGTVVLQSADAKNAAVFTTDGKAVQAGIVRNGDIFTVNLNSLPEGSYIIKAGKTAFKVSKK